MSMYFENDKTLETNKQKKKIYYPDLTIELYTDNGIFSKDKLDYGTKVLLKNIPIEQLKGRILDLGCGYGAIGIYLAIRTTAQIEMVDINERAINLSQENIQTYHLKNAIAYQSDIYSSAKNKYNFIITNPPIRAGKPTVIKFLTEAKNYLLPQGELWFVMRKDHGVKSTLKYLDQIYQTEIVEKEKGFYVIKCTEK